MEKKVNARQRELSRARPEIVRLLIESKLSAGHVELEIDGRFHGFWWDPNKKFPIKTTRLRKKSRGSKLGVFGGWRGDFKELSQAELALSYNGMYVDRRRVHKSPPEFTVYELAVTVQQKARLVDFLRRKHARRPEYSAYSTGRSRNCVTLSVEALIHARILPQSFARRLKVPSPKHLEVVMRKMGKKRPISKRYLFYLQCAHFRRSKPNA